ncbi:MAG: hypothetical protein U0L67_05290 [Paludibacteraceae bacterium]|nr:hypothetical protein [Paludibacteraceae bacterium]
MTYRLEYFDIPEDLSTYVGYFAVLFHNQNHPHKVWRIGQFAG